MGRVSRMATPTQATYRLQPSKDTGQNSVATLPPSTPEREHHGILAGGRGRGNNERADAVSIPKRRFH
jgi:hypothetical protein